MARFYYGGTAAAETDNWDDDWDEDAEPPALPQLGALKSPAAPATDDKFAGEDEGEEEPSYVVPETQKSKKPARPAYEDKGAVSVPDEGPLDDPLAEKMRQQKLVEAADLKAAQDLFGGAGTPLNQMRPKTLREFEAFGRALALQYLKPHEQASHYKGLLKAVLKSATENLPLQETKDLETTLAGIRSDKIKADAAEKAAAKKAGKKKTLNVGSKGGSAGLDDYVYDTAATGDDDYDFM